MIRFIGLLLWLTPAIAFSALDRVIWEDASWWWLVPVFVSGVTFHALLDWYVRESFLDAVRQGRRDLP